MVQITGKYQLATSENFEPFLKELGLNLLLRKAATMAKPTVEISQNGDQWKIKTASTFKTSEISFKLGEEFEEVRQDDKHVKSTIVLDGDNKLIHSQTGCESPVQVIREFNDKGMTVIATVNGVTSTRTYNRE